MKKAKDVQEFVERIDATKKVNPKDLSSDQDFDFDRGAFGFQRCENG